MAFLYIIESAKEWKKENRKWLVLMIGWQSCGRLSSENQDLDIQLLFAFRYAIGNQNIYIRMKNQLLYIWHLLIRITCSSIPAMQKTFYPENLCTIAIKPHPILYPLN
jgi:hypothetical protein